jgi:thymidylate synthase
MEISKLINLTHQEFIKTSTLAIVSDWQGNKDFEGEGMKLVRNRNLEFDIPETMEELQQQTHCDLPWAEDHFQERMSGEPTNPGKTYKYWPYHKDLDLSKYKTELFSHTYQERYWPAFANAKKSFDGGSYKNFGIHFQLGDLNDVINLLNGNPKTRQAYLPIWFPEDTWAAGNNKRVPCTLGYYFWIEDNKLYCNYIIRSCDLFRHFRNDIYLTGRLMQEVLDFLNFGRDDKYKLGTMTMMIFNLHLFNKDVYPFSRKENNIKGYGK